MGKYLAVNRQEQKWCQFSRDHPEFNLSGPRTEFDYAHPEVRDWRFGHIQELAQKWDIDGIELDFVRFPVFFKEPAAEKAPLMTELVGRVRAALDEAGARRGRHIQLAVRPLENFQMSLSVGLDVRTWLERGWIDLLIAGGGYMTMDLPIDEMVEVAHTVGCPVYPCIIPSSAKTIDSGLPAGKQWWQTKFEVETSRVRIYSKAMEDASYGQPWAQVLLSDLQVVRGPGLKLGGEGDLALRRIGVTPQSARGI